MKSTLLDATGPRTWALIFDKGDESVAGLTAFAKAQKLGAAHFTAIGAFSDVTLGYFDRAKRDYKKIPLHEQVEVLSLLGDVALDKGEPKTDKERIELSGASICVGERTIFGSYSASVDQQKESAELVFTGELPVDLLVSHRLPLANIRAAFDLALHPDSQSLKIILEPQRWTE